MYSPLVTVQWLKENMHNEKLVILDASMDKVIGMEPIIYPEPICIPGSVKIDLENAFCDLESDQVHAMPTQEQFTRVARQAGINRDSEVVIYDNQGIYSAPRAWWIFKTMGFTHVYVLDGGLPDWIAANHETDTEYRLPEAGNAVGNYQSSQVRSARYLLDNIDNDGVMVIDARSTARFMGLAPEPRPGVRGGHIPNSLNMPFPEVLEGVRFKSGKCLKALFSETVKPEQAMVFSCGSGITACILLLAAVIAGRESVSLYDGSWSEWGGDPQWPIATDAE